MPALTLTPSTVEPGGQVHVDGSGFTARKKVQLATDGIGWTTNEFRVKPNGTFSVGLPKVPTAEGAHVIAARYSNTVTVVAQATLTVKAVVVEPPPVEPPPPTTVPFLGYPISTQRTWDGGAVVIEKLSFRGGTLNAPAGVLTIRNATSIVIRDVDWADLIGVYVYGCTGSVTIERLRSRNIGDGTIGAGHSNHIQFAECSLVGHVSDSQFLGGWTEDMISTWHSGGKGVGQELVFERLRVQGLVADTATARAWKSSAGTGIILSDGAGSPRNGNIIVRDCTFLTPGQVGIQHIDGPNLQTYNNVVYGEKRPNNNNPITSWEGTPRGECHHNRYYWINNDGFHPSPWFHGGSQLNVHDNVQDPNIDVAAMRVVL